MVTSPLLTATALQADFASGHTPLGHHWRLTDGDGAPAGRTRRVYDGVGGKLGRRLAVVTGLSTAGAVRIEILDAADTHVATLSAEGGDRIRAALATPDGTAIGSAHHDRERGEVDLLDASGRVVGRILAPADSDDAPVPFTIVSADGGEVAVMERRPQAMIGPGSLILGDLSARQNNYEAELAKHYGFRHSHTYGVTVTAGRALNDPLRTLVALSPVLAAHLY